jgi:DNA-binding NarL/FixJ family response regulator
MAFMLMETTSESAWGSWPLGKQAPHREPTIFERSPEARPQPGADAGPPARVLVVDDSLVFLSAVEGLLRSAPGFRVAGRAYSGLGALEQAMSLEPDLILMDISMPGMDGLEAARLLARRPGAAPVVLMTVHEPDEYRDAAEAAGAAALLSKKHLGDQLLPLIGRLLGDRKGPGATAS